MQVFMNVYVPGWLIFIGGILLISAVNGATVQAMVNHAGRSNTQIWYMKPGIFVHELLHAAVARLFGLQVTNFSLRADPLQGSAAHVSLRYDRHDPLAQLGLFLSSSAPVWGISVVLLVLGRWAFFPAGNQVWEVLAASSSLSEKWVMMRSMVVVNWQWLAIFLVVTLILTPGVALSHIAPRPAEYVAKCAGCVFRHYRHFLSLPHVLASGLRVVDFIEFEFIVT